ncbi:nuclear mitotic apparatus protein 1 isoform X1 [Sinocyclocheilus anshuiensis]|uniref:nuclear mitotic apparatus protein 1 isoform X1 n=1 Tax=Sinocyclocheilus anshuiensis TaxID=1608454 RepID=UPI0007BA838F|nr:PREDICTED: nuclear mitotic apparatus protein 1-like isoform X1 [Sinocyclocheilus anshuiensis]
MQLNEVKEAALLLWINSVYPEESFTNIIQMMDGHRLLKFAYRVQGKAFCDGLLVSPFPNVMEMIFSMLQADFQFSPRQASLMLRKISQGVELELQLAKVVLVLCYCGFKTYNMVPLDTKTGLMIASMFHFVEDDADDLSLDEGLDRFLTKASVMTFSTSSSENSCCSPLYTDDESPIFSQVQNPPRVQFQEHFTVACSSVSSSVKDVMSTPQLLKRLRKVLAREGDVRDELEKELANQISINLEKEGVISQLQHRVERMLREQGELEKDHKAALLELQEKNESLIRRVHEVVKQCQDLKTENTQKKKVIDVLTKEKQTFAAQMRNAFAPLATAEGDVAKHTLAHESAQAEWKSSKKFLELNERVITRWESLSEQAQILQGKISVLGDELQKAQSQEKGVVLGTSIEALTKIESFLTQIVYLSEQISLKDEEITNLRNKYDSVDHELKLVKEQNIELKEVIKSNCQVHEDTVKKLQQELDSAASNASEKQEEMLVLSAEVTSLKEQICCYSENGVRKQQELSVLEAQHGVLKEKLTSLQNQLAEVKESELKRELCHQTVLREKAQGLERTVREHHTEISALASERDAQISSLKAEMKNQQLRSQRLRAQLELKVEKQNGSILALKNMARQWKQQNEELLEKLKIMFTQLQHYSGKNKEEREMNKSLVNSLQARRREVEDLQVERDQAKARVKSLEARLAVAERHLQERRKMTDDTEDVRCRETQQDTNNESLNFELNYSFNANAHDLPGIGVEDKPEHTADDWMRVAELQVRNKACLPHLKSSYPLESRTTVGLPSFTLTDEDLRMGDPAESIRRAALHLHESQHSHTPQTLRQPGSLLHDLNIPEQYIGTGEAKKLVSCVSRTVMLKSRHANRLSNAEPKRRQSVMFTIVNTPKRQRGSLLQRGLKHRKEACKSPTVGSRALQPAMSAANSRSPLSLRKCPRNKSPKKGEQ